MSSRRWSGVVGGGVVDVGAAKAHESSAARRVVEKSIFEFQ